MTIVGADLPNLDNNGRTTNFLAASSAINSVRLDLMHEASANSAVWKGLLHPCFHVNEYFLN